MAQLAAKGSSKDVKSPTGGGVSDTTAIQVEIKRLQTSITNILDSDKERDAKIQRIFDELNDLKQLKIKLNTVSETTNDNKARITSIEEELNELRLLKQRIENLEAYKDKKPTKKIEDMS